MSDGWCRVCGRTTRTRTALSDASCRHCGSGGLEVNPRSRVGRFRARRRLVSAARRRLRFLEAVNGGVVSPPELRGELRERMLRPAWRALARFVESIEFIDPEGEDGDET